MHTLEVASVIILYVDLRTSLPSHSLGQIVISSHKDYNVGQYFLLSHFLMPPLLTLANTVFAHRKPTIVFLASLSRREEGL